MPHDCSSYLDIYILQGNISIITMTKGYCYNIDGLCEDDEKCLCDSSKEYVKIPTEAFKRIVSLLKKQKLMKILCPVCNKRHVPDSSGICSSIITGHGYYEGGVLKISEAGKRSYKKLN